MSRKYNSPSYRLKKEGRQKEGRQIPKLPEVAARPCRRDERHVNHAEGGGVLKE